MPLFGKKTAEPAYETRTTNTTEPKQSSGLFGSKHSQPAPAPVTTERRSGMFGSKHSQPAPAPVTTERRSGMFGSKHSQPAPVPTTERRSGMFGRGHRETSSSRSRSNSPRRKGTGLLSRVNHTGDPSTRAAHERVLTAETAEREAEKALQHARTMVRDAKDHVKRLEREAAEEARLAKMKQKDSAAISKRAGKLGGM